MHVEFIFKGKLEPRFRPAAVEDGRMRPIAVADLDMDDLPGAWGHRPFDARHDRVGDSHGAASDLGA